MAGNDPFPLVFLGLVVTLDCVFAPRCLYCNQIWLPRHLTIWSEDSDEILRKLDEFQQLAEQARSLF